VIAGKATKNEKLQALSHIENMSLTMPKLNIVMTNDIMPDINNAIKNEKTRF